MKIYHVRMMQQPLSKMDGKYINFEKYFGHIITINGNRDDVNFAHMFAPDGTKVHHLTYDTFKAMASHFTHVYEHHLTKTEMKDIVNLFKQAEILQLQTLINQARCILNSKVGEDIYAQADKHHV